MLLQVSRDGGEMVELEMTDHLCSIVIRRRM